jgi:ribosomal protein S18 acetylase RimI-like enzyme
VRLNELKGQSSMAHIKIDGWKEAYKGIIDDDYLAKFSYEEQEKKYIASFDEYKDKVLVILKDDVVIGYASLKLDEGELESLYLKPEFKGKGIGTILFFKVCSYFKEKGFKKMILWCLSDNIKALNFYQKLGCKKIGNKDALIGDKYYKEEGYLFEL